MPGSFRSRQSTVDNRQSSRGRSGTGLQPCVGLFALAFAARVAYLVMFNAPFFTIYWTLAGSLLRTGTLAVNGAKVTDFEPLYPVFLAVCRAVAGDRVLIVQWLQIAVASAGTVFVYRLTRKLSGSTGAAAMAGLLFAAHPLLIRQAAALSDLAFVTTLLVIFADVFVDVSVASGFSRAGSIGRAALAGGVLGLAALARFMVVPVAAFGCTILMIERRRMQAAAFIVAVLMLVAPWMIRNHRVNGSWWPTRGGMNLYIGNSPYTAALLPTYDLDLLQEIAAGQFQRARPDLSSSSPAYELELDRFLSAQARAHLALSPIRSLREKLLNVMYFLSPRLVPYDVAAPDTRVVVAPGQTVMVENSAARPRMEVWTYAIASGFVLITAAIGVFQRRRHLRHEDVILWSIFATLVVVSAVYVPASRYLAPTLFVLLFYSAVALTSLSTASRT